MRLGMEKFMNVSLTPFDLQVNRILWVGAKYKNNSVKEEELKLELVELEKNQALLQKETLTVFASRPIDMHTVCPRSLVPSYIGGPLWKMGKTSWTYSFLFKNPIVKIKYFKERKKKHLVNTLKNHCKFSYFHFILFLLTIFPKYGLGNGNIYLCL